MLAFVQIFIHLRPAFSRASTFYRALIVVLAMSLKPDKEGGVTPLVRALPFRDPGAAYGRLVGFFSSTAFDLQELCDLWFTVLITIFKPFVKGDVPFFGRNRSSSSPFDIKVLSFFP